MQINALQINCGLWFAST